MGGCMRGPDASSSGIGGASRPNFGLMRPGFGRPCGQKSGLNHSIGLGMMGMAARAGSASKGRKGKGFKGGRGRLGGKGGRGRR